MILPVVVPIRKPFEGLTLEVRTLREWRLRLLLATWLVKLAAWVGGAQFAAKVLDVEEEDGESGASDHGPYGVGVMVSVVTAFLVGLLLSCAAVGPLAAQSVVAFDSVAARAEVQVTVRWTAPTSTDAQAVTFSRNGTVLATAKPAASTRTKLQWLPARAPSDTTWFRAQFYRAGNLIGSATDSWPKRATVTPPAPPSAPTPTPSSNEPTGYARFTDHDWSSILPSGWYHDGDRTRYQLLSETSAPAGGRFLRAGFRVGETGGPLNATPFRIQRNLQALEAGQLYWAFWIRVSPNFQGHPTATNKLGFAWMRGANIVFLSLEGVDAGPLNLMPRLQTRETSDPREYFQPNQGASATFSRGAWHRVEMLAIANTASDRNGRIALWLDGVKTHDYRDLRFVVTGEGHTWDYVDVTPLWGGGGGVIREAMTLDYGPMYLSAAR